MGDGDYPSGCGGHRNVVEQCRHMGTLDLACTSSSGTIDLCTSSSGPISSNETNNTAQRSKDDIFDCTDSDYSTSSDYAAFSAEMDLWWQDSATSLESSYLDLFEMDISMLQQNITVV